MKKLTLAVLVASIFAASSAMAAGANNEISAMGFVDSSKDDSPGAQQNTITMLNLAYGMYFTPQLVGRVSGTVVGSETGGTTSTATMLGLGAKYYFAEGAKSAWVPFVFGDFTVLSMESGGTSASGIGFDAGAGASNFLTETVSFDVDVRAYSNTVSYSGGDATINGTRVSFGFTARF